MVNIRKAELSDLDSIMKLDLNFGAKWNESKFEHNITNSNYIFYVAEYEDKIIGFICNSKGMHVVNASAFEAYENFDSNSNIHIEKVTVDPNYSYKNGNSETKDTAKLLMDKSTEGYKTVTLNVRVSNKKAINSYLKYGFEAMDITETYTNGDGKQPMILFRNLH